MCKYIYIALLFLLCAGRASAQFTLVSGTVTDVNAVAYACGTISASIVNNNGQSLYLNGVQFSPSPSATKLGCPTDPTTSRTPGAFQVQLADNTQIKCGSGASIVTCAIQTQWLLTVNTLGIPPPAGTGPQTCTATVTISGSSQTITSSFSACPALVLSGVGSPFIDPSFVGAALPSLTGQVQVRQSESFNGSGNPFQLPLDNFTTQGNTILCMSRWAGAQTFVSLTDTQSDTFTQVGVNRTTTSTFGSAFNVRWDIATNIVGGLSTTINLQLSAAPSSPGLACMELTPSTVDQTASTTGSNTAMASPNVTTTVASETLYGIGFLNAPPNFGNGCTPGNGYIFVGASNCVPAHVVEQQNVFSTGTFNATATIPNNADWAMAIVAMKGTVTTPIVSTATGTGPFSLGTITSQLTPVQFRISGGQIGAGQNQLNLVVTTGTISNPGFALDASTDGGFTWFNVPCVQRSTVNTIASDPVPVYATQCSLVGLMGETGTNFRFGVTQGFGISNLNVWGSI